VGQRFVQTNKGAGGAGDYKYSIFGSRPSNTQFSGTTGTISGVPQTVGNFAYVVQVTDKSNNYADQLVTGNITRGDVSNPAQPPAPPFTLASTASRLMMRGEDFSQNNQVLQDGTYSFAVSAGALPPGTKLVKGADHKSAVVTGKPSEVGPFVYIIQATAADGSGSEQATQLVTGRITEEGEDPRRKTDSPCPEWARHPEHNLFLKAWLHNYFDKINTVTQTEEKNYSSNPLCDNGPLDKSSNPYGNPCLPDRTAFTAVELSTTFKILADVNAGLTPEAFASSVFLLPISGVTGDLNSDYSNDIDIKMTLCDNTKGGCSSAKALGLLDPISQLYEDQCHAYAVLSPIEGTTVQPPKDVLGVLASRPKQPMELTCSRALGCYIPKTDNSTQQETCPMPSPAPPA
jgi:hypothetical protein